MNHTTTKKNYYISVSGKSVDTEPSRSEQLQVLATEEEMNELRIIFERLQSDDDWTAFKAPVPYKSADHDPATDKFNQDLLELYRIVYRIGTEDTKTHIRSMNIINELKNTDYDYPGYPR